MKPKGKGELKMKKFNEVVEYVKANKKAVAKKAALVVGGIVGATALAVFVAKRNAANGAEDVEVGIEEMNELTTDNSEQQ